MADTAALVVALSAQLTKFEKDMQSANDIAAKHVKQIENTFSNANIHVGGLEEFADKFTKLLTIGGIIETVRQLAELNEQVARIGDKSEQLGLTTQRFQELQFAAAATGSSTEKMTAFLDQFSRKVGEAATGTGAFYNFLKVNNIEATKFAKIPINEQLEKFADLIKGLKSPQEQMNTLAIASGRNFGDLLSVFRDGSAGLQQFYRDAQTAGVVIDDALIERAKKANAQWQVLVLRIKTFFEEAALQGADAAKTLANNSEKTGREWSDTLKGYWQSFINYMKDSQPEALKNATELMDGIKEIIAKKNQEILFEQAQNRQRSGADILSAPGEDPRFKRVGPSEAEEAATKTFNEQAEAIRKIIAAQTKRNELLAAEAQGVGKTISESVALTTQINLENEAKEKNITITDGQRAAFQKVAAAAGQQAQATDLAKRNWAGLNSAVQFAGDQMINVIDSLIFKTASFADAAKSLEQALVKALLQAAILGQGPLANVLGFQTGVPGGTGGLLGPAVGFLKGILPGRAVGGPVSAGSPYMVGENGPELFVPKGGGQIVPGSVVRGGSAGLSVVVNNYASGDVTTTQQRRSQGPNMEELVIGIVKKTLSSGDADAANRARFGLRPNKVR